MGDNAKQSWSWHNNEIGQGYQAKGVIRQNYGDKQSMKVIDMTTKTEDIDSKKRKHDDVTNDVSKSSEKKKHKDKSHKKHKKEKSHKDKKEKDKKHKKHKHSHNEDKDNFNPLLQILATRLSNTTRHFSCEGWPL